MITQTQAYFCPRCHSPLVSFSALGLGESPASCGACNWKGARADLATTPFVHGGGSEEEVLQRLVLEFRKLFTKEWLLSMARWLNKWGFMPADAKAQPAALARYMDAVAKAAITSILQTRAEMEKAKANVS